MRALCGELIDASAAARVHHHRVVVVHIIHAVVVHDSVVHHVRVEAVGVVWNHATETDKQSQISIRFYTTVYTH